MVTRAVESSQSESSRSSEMSLSSSSVDSKSESPPSIESLRHEAVLSMRHVELLRQRVSHDATRSSGDSEVEGLTANELVELAAAPVLAVEERDRSPLMARSISAHSESMKEVERCGIAAPSSVDSVDSSSFELLTPRMTIEGSAGSLVFDDALVSLPLGV